MSMASSSRDGVAVCDNAAALARPFFLGGMVRVLGQLTRNMLYNQLSFNDGLEYSEHPPKS